MPSLDRPAPYFSQPGPDQRIPEISEHVDAILATVGADRMIDPEEWREIQRLIGGIQAIASQRSAMAAAEQEQPMFSEETSPFGATEGTEDVSYLGSGGAGTSYMQG